MLVAAHQVKDALGLVVCEHKVRLILGRSPLDLPDRAIAKEDEVEVMQILIFAVSDHIAEDLRDL